MYDIKYNIINIIHLKVKHNKTMGILIIWDSLLLVSYSEDILSIAFLT